MSQVFCSWTVYNRMPRMNFLDLHCIPYNVLKYITLQETSLPNVFYYLHLNFKYFSESFSFFDVKYPEGHHYLSDRNNKECTRGLDCALYFSDKLTFKSQLLHLQCKGINVYGQYVQGIHVSFINDNECSRPSSYETLPPIAGLFLVTSQ